MAEPVATVVSDLLEAWNAHDVSRVVALCAPQYEGRDVAEPRVRRGQADVHDAVIRYLASFPDLRVNAEDLVVAGNRAALVWTAHGTHQGGLMHIPATGREVDVRGVSLLTVEGGRVSRELVIWDVAGLLRALGLLPDL